MYKIFFNFNAQKYLTFVVLISCRTPQLPKTRSLAAWGSATQEKVMSLSAMTSLGVSASRAPASTKSRTLSVVRFQTLTLCPEFSKFFTIPDLHITLPLDLCNSGKQ